jgi:hypothetical protein
VLSNKIIGVFYIFLALHYISVGQSMPLQVESHTGNYSFSIKRNGTGLERSGNLVIRQLAMELTKEPEKTNYVVAYTYHLFLGTIVKGKRQVGLRLDVKNISGDTCVSGLNISDALSPRLASFHLRINSNNGNLLDSATYAGIIPGKDTLLILPHSADTIDKLQVRDIEMSRIVFGYDAMGLTQISQLFKAIKLYHAAHLLTELAQTQSDLINRQVKNPSPEILMKVYELSGVVRLLTKLQDQCKIVTNISDPYHLISRQRILAYRLHFIQQLFIENSVNKAVCQSQSNITQLSERWVLMQVDKLTDEQIPESARIVFYQSGKLEIMPNDLAFLKKAASLLIKNIRPDIFPEGYLWALSYALNKSYLRQGEKLSLSGRYSEAVDLISNAVRMCEAIPYKTCSDRMYQQQSIALYGIYHAYIRIARKALAENKPALANDYADAASKFQRKNANFIISDIEVKKLYGEVAEAWYHIGIAKLKSRGTMAASADLRRAEIASKFAKLNSIADSLMAEPGNINQASFFGDSVRELNVANSLEEDKFSKAKYQNPVKLIKGNQLPDHEKMQAALNEIREDLDEVRIALMSIDCESALNLLDKVKQLMILFGLPDEDPLTETAGIYWYEADSCLCEKKQGECDLLQSHAEQFCAGKNFLEAFITSGKALKIIVENSSCDMNPRPIELFHTALKWPAAYQQIALCVDSLVNSGNYGQAVKEYSEAGKIFVLYNLSERGLVHLPLAEYVGTKHNRDLYESAINEILNQNRIEESLILLNKMEAEKFTPEECRDSQQHVAEKIAVRDRMSVNSLPVHRRLIIYTGGSGWYSHFKKVYLKTIRLKS